MSHNEHIFYDNILRENILTRLEKKHVEEGEKNFWEFIFFSVENKKICMATQNFENKKKWIKNLKDCLRTVTAIDVMFVPDPVRCTV